MYKTANEIVYNKDGFSSEEKDLLDFVITSSNRNSYDKFEGNVEELMVVTGNVMPSFVAKVALHCKKHLRNRPMVHALSASLAVSGAPWLSEFYKNVCDNPSDISEIISFYFYKMNNGSNTPIIHPMKRAFRELLENYNGSFLEDFLMEDRVISLQRLIVLFHPTASHINGRLYNEVMDKNTPIRSGKDSIEFKSETVNDIKIWDGMI